MYYPFLRGRQFELLALRELLDKNLISKNHVRPIIEPIKNTAVFNSTIKTFIEKEFPVHVVINPQNGSFNFQKFQEKSREFEGDTKKAFLLSQNSGADFYESLKGEEFVAIYEKSTDFQNGKKLYENSLSPEMNFIEETSKNRFLRVVNQADRLGIISDNFEKAARNVDYDETADDFFSDHHLVYNDDHYEGFCDYSIIGKEFVEGGFAPRAVVIHALYFNENNELYVKHFKSDSNDDISDPAGKFSEALDKLVAWYKTISSKNKSAAMEEFVRLYNEKRYPGLGVVKKLSIMHHLEIMEKFLAGQG
ncbi:sce7725 family protein [Lactococcus garvieae]|uniref:sce7725 family protein n=1 Tax=Lactococcus garvieae TaxID=1363 RepID=UPI0002D93214|nr:sce7725 family protein [Lactococcus garvieae]